MTQQVTLTFNIPNGELQNFLNYFTAIKPIPDADGDGTPDFTQAAWVREYLRLHMADIIIMGKRKLDNASIPPLSGGYLS